MTNYLISGVWKDEQKRITHVMLHEIELSESNDGIWSQLPAGKKTNPTKVVQLIN